MGEGVDSLSKFVSYPSERLPCLLFGSDSSRGIFETPVHLIECAGESRTLVARLVAHGYYKLEIFLGEFFDMF